MKKTVSTLLLLGSMFLVPAATKTGPLISADADEFDAGTIKKGTVSSAKHMFKIKNTGDSVLVIREARPG
ncbi:MAG TPA: hypothetical protein VLX68_09125 [Chitinivibrionales bacterium]|nr:hypothetical protein [Chitinivibrionales bacterium]